MFRGQTVMITGSGTGIGLAVAKQFAHAGASVIILGRRSGPLEEAAGELRKIMEEGHTEATVQIFPGVDVSDEGAVTKMFDSLESSGTVLDVLVNNAGVSGPVTCFSNDDLGEFRSAVAIHLTGTFWMSHQALRVMKAGSRIITISTFFTEERPLEQRPYRFRGPYTASQGAKNRLAEAMSWELKDRGIISIATNPGPVHSDRIYKTVYPKAASEFLRVSGYEGLTPSDVESAAGQLVQLLGEDQKTIDDGVAKVAQKMAGEKNADAHAMTATLSGLLMKIQSVAEKIQLNTSRMIADEQFLSQNQVAETILMLSGSSISQILNGKVIPGDRVFYPVRGHVGCATSQIPSPDLSGDSVVFTVDATSETDVARVLHLAGHVEKCGARPVCLISKECPDKLRAELESALHSHVVDLGSADELDRWLATASQKAGKIRAVVHVTGQVPLESPLMGLGRAEWDGLVDRFINRTATVVQRSFESFVPGGGADPRLYRDSTGAVVVIGPDLPVGKKVTGLHRSRAELFRGALRPFTATLNQELGDVLGSKVRLFTALAGRVDGGQADDANMALALDYFVSPESAASAEVVFCVDERR